MPQPLSSCLAPSSSAPADAKPASPPLPELDRYELLAKLGEGSMGTVFRGRHRITGEAVAVKMIAPDLASQPEQLRRFEQEFALASRLSHPNMVRYLDLGQYQGVPYLVMELIEGGSLGERIGREGRLAEAEAVRLISQVAQALDYAHANEIVHRDVKPDNILVATDGTAKLTDLGLAKVLTADLGMTRPGKGLGTAIYMAPEQFTNAKKVDLRCDIYSLGATLYEALTGQMPFQAATLWQVFMKKGENDFVPARQLVPELSEPLDRLLRRALSADPNGRPGSCTEFLRALAGEDIVPAPPSTPAVPASAEDKIEAPAPSPALPPRVSPSQFATSPAAGQESDAIDWWQWVAAGGMALGAAVLSALALSHFH